MNNYTLLEQLGILLSMILTFGLTLGSISWLILWHDDKQQ